METEKIERLVKCTVINVTEARPGPRGCKCHHHVCGSEGTDQCLTQAFPAGVWGRCK